MSKSQLELMVIYQDLLLMTKEIEESTCLTPLQVKDDEPLYQAIEEIKAQIEPRYFNIFKRLSTKYKHPIVPVKNNTCLGCRSMLPTSLTTRGRNDQTIYTCENCGRILYWI